MQFFFSLCLFSTCHEGCFDAPSAVTGGVLRHHSQVVNLSALQLTQLTGSCIAPTASIVLRVFLLSVHSVGHGAVSSLPGNCGHVRTTLEGAGDIDGVTWS